MSQVAFVFRMARRDSRHSRSRLRLMMLATVLGISSLVGLTSFSENLREAIDESARALLGADLVVASREPISGPLDALLRDVAAESSDEIAFSSMVYSAASGSSRISQVSAVSGRFPLYGEYVTDPPDAVRSLRDGTVIADEALLAQLGAHVGETVSIGGIPAVVAARLLQAPGDIAIRDLVAPRVVVTAGTIAGSRLLGEGSRVRYKRYLAFAPAAPVESMLRKLLPKIHALGATSETVAERKESFGKVMRNVSRFLTLTCLLALLLGGVGVASSVHAYAVERAPSVAILRCLGATPALAPAIIFIEVMGYGGAAVLAGIVLGVALQFTFPLVFATILPVAVPIHTVWPQLITSGSMALLFIALFALGPLLALRHVPPLAALRPAELERRPRDALPILLWSVLAAAVLRYVQLESGELHTALVYTGAVGGAFLVLALGSRFLVYAMRRYLPRSAPFVIRQGCANLFRPYNQTTLLGVSLGIVGFLGVMIVLAERTLDAQIAHASEAGRPTMILFDIQEDERERLHELLGRFKLSLIEETPVITMRLSSVKGRSVTELMQDTKSGAPSWTLKREYRSTYRSALSASEVLTEGSLSSRVAPDLRPVPVSVEKGMAEKLAIGIGDEVVFDVQGVEIQCRVASIREVNWQRIQPNFFFVFPPGVLEDAPRFYMGAVAVPSAELSAAVQRAAAVELPTISIIDVRLIVQIVDALLSQLSFIVRCMASFTVCTAVIVLIGVLRSTRSHRATEVALLKTLGARRRTLVLIQVVEHAILGVLGSATGAALAMAGHRVLALQVFKIAPVFGLLPAFTTVAVVAALCIFIGMLGTSDTYRVPPLATLREENG